MAIRAGARGAALLGAAAAGGALGALLVGWSWRALRAGWAPASAGVEGLAQALTALAALAGGLLLLWLAAGAAVGTLEVIVPARGASRRRLDAVTRHVVPGVTRRLVAAVLGVAATCGTALPASAAGSPAGGGAVAVDVGWPAAPPPGPDVGPGPGIAPPPDSTADGAWQPDRPAEPVRTAPADLGALAPSPRERAVAEDAVVVHRGDTLWDIAARHLPPGATAAQIAVEWPRWYAANRAVVGADPHHIVPGMRLLPPGSGS